MTASVTRHPALPAHDSSRIVLVSAEERARAFRNAQRHSHTVRVLKLLLPICAVASLGAYVASPQLWLRVARPDLNASLGQVEITSDKLRMTNPRFDGYTADQGHYVVTAKAATQTLDDPDEAKLETIQGRLTQADDSWMQLDANGGLMHVKAKKLRLDDGIVITTSTSMRARLASADIDLDSKHVTSDAVVDIDMPNGTFQGQGVDIEGDKKRVLFKSRVKAHLVPPKGAKPAPATATVAPAAAAKPLVGFSAMPALSGAPADVTAQQLEILDDVKKATFMHAVVAKQAAVTLKAEQLEVGYRGQQPAPGQAANAALAGDPGSSITYAIASKNVLITAADGRSAVADWARFDQKAQTMTLHGNVVLKQNASILHATDVVVDMVSRHTRVTGTGRITGHFEPDAATAAATSAPEAATGAPASAGSTNGLAMLTSTRSAADIEASQLDVTDDDGLAVFTGTVQVTQRGNRLSGERLEIDMAHRHMAMSGPGRVTGTFEAEATQAPASKPRRQPTTVASGDASAASSIGQSLAGLSSGSGTGPTSFEADNLTVDDEKGVATFTGSVIVVRGDHRINAETIVAYYAGGGSTAGGGASQLVRITAKDRVTVHAPGNQVASSDLLLFDAHKNLLTMTGNVIVSQGTNVIRGEKLVVDLETGESHFEQTPQVTAAPSGRIQVLITPQGIKQLNAATKPQTGSAPAAAPSKAKPKSSMSASDILLPPDQPQ